MAEWGRIVPLIILLFLLAVGAFIGLVIYGIAMEVTTKTREKMKDNNVTMTRKGVTVALKELKDEDYKDISQRYQPQIFPIWTYTDSACSILVDIWNYGNPFSPRKRRFWRRGGRRSSESPSSSPSPSPPARNGLGHSSDYSIGSE